MSKKNKIHSAVAHITSTYNNTIVNITDESGNTLCWYSAGRKFKGARKPTPYAAQVVGEKIGAEAKKLGVQTLKVRMKGTGIGKDSVVKALKAEGLDITQIIDITPIAHNGCRPKKRRRI